MAKPGPIKLAVLVQVEDRTPDIIGHIEIPVKVEGDLPNLTISMGTESLQADLVKLLRDTADEIEREDDADLADPEHITCPDCEYRLLGDPRFATIEHGPDGSHIYEPRLTPIDA